MKVKDVMSKNLFTIAPDATLKSAAQTMKDNKIGMLPVQTRDGKLVGTITDRDIAVRAVALGLEPEHKVEEAMTRGCETCHEDDSVSDVAQRMTAHKVRRVVVVSGDKEKPRGVVSLGDLAFNAESRKVAGDVLSRVAVKR